MPTVEDDIEQQLRAPNLLLELLEEPHLDYCPSPKVLSVDQRRARRETQSTICKSSWGTNGGASKIHTGILKVVIRTAELKE